MYSFRSAGGDRQGGDEVHESQLRELGGQFLPVWEKLLSWLVGWVAAKLGLTLGIHVL